MQSMSQRRSLEGLLSTFLTSFGKRFFSCAGALPLVRGLPRALDGKTCLCVVLLARGTSVCLEWTRPLYK